MAIIRRRVASATWRRRHSAASGVAAAACSAASGGVKRRAYLGLHYPRRRRRRRQLITGGIFYGASVSEKVKRSNNAWRRLANVFSESIDGGGALNRQHRRSEKRATSWRASDRIIGTAETAANPVLAMKAACGNRQRHLQLIGQLNQTGRRGGV